MVDLGPVPDDAVIGIFSHNGNNGDFKLNPQRSIAINGGIEFIHIGVIIVENIDDAIHKMKQFSDQQGAAEFYIIDETTNPHKTIKYS